MELNSVKSVKVKEESHFVKVEETGMTSAVFENVEPQFERQAIPPHILQQLSSRKEGNMQLVQLEDGKFTYIIE